DDALAAKSHRRPDRRVAGHRQLAIGREDADSHVAPGARGRHHEGRLGEVELARDRLHQRRVEAAGVEHDRQLVAGQRAVGEDVEDAEGEPHRRAASRKGSIGARTSPAPTWPTPASRCAMPVLISGWMPVSAMRRTSIPVGEPRKSSDGMAWFGFSASVISYISRVASRAAVASPPTTRVMAGAAAIAKPPRP